MTTESESSNENVQQVPPSPAAPVQPPPVLPAPTPAYSDPFKARPAPSTMTDRPRQPVIHRAKPPAKKLPSGLIIGLSVGVGVIVLLIVLGIIGVKVYRKMTALTAPNARKISSNTAPQVATPPWQVFTDTAGRFSILFPGTPTNSQVPVQEGSFCATAISYMVEHEEVIYLAQFYDVPDSFPTSHKSTREFFSGVKAGVAKQSRTPPRHEEALDLDGNPGMEYIAEMKGMTVQMRIFLIKRRVYMTTVLSAMTIPNSDTNRFLDSFRLI